MKVHVFDFRWANETQCLIQAIHNGRLGKKALEIGTPISFMLEGPVTCAGAMTDSGWVPCGSAETEFKKKCDLCRSKEGSFIYTAFDGFNTDMYSDADLAKLEGPHVVYLALFEKGMTKVGVSKMSRKTMRQVEQGAHATLYIAETPNGILARQIETMIRASGIQDKVNQNQKQKLVMPHITNEEAEKDLREMAAKTKAALKDYEILQQYISDDPEFVCWEEHYGIPAIRKSSKPYHAVKIADGEGVSGVIRAIKGPFLIMETEEEMVCVSGKSLAGYTVDFTKRSPGLDIKGALQNTLF